MAGYRVRYVLAAKLVNELVEAADDKQLTKTIARYGRVDLLCIDELGYMELDRRGAELLFQVLTEREEKSSMAIASNENLAGPRSSPTPGSARPSSTASPSAATSSRPARLLPPRANPRQSRARRQLTTAPGALCRQVGSRVSSGPASVPAYLPRRPAARSSRPVPAVAARWAGRGSARQFQRAGTGSAERLVQNPGTTLAHLPIGRLPGWSGQYLEQSGGVDACGEAEKSLRQLVGGLHGGVVADAVE